MAGRKCPWKERRPRAWPRWSGPILAAAVLALLRPFTELEARALFPYRFRVAAKFDGFTVGVHYVPGGKKLGIRRRERPTTAEAWESSENEYSVRYEIADVATRLGGEEWVVAGTLPDGRSVIELWRFPRRPGRWIHTYDGDPCPVGTPCGDYTGSESLFGGKYVPPPSRWWAPERNTLFEGTLPGTVRCIAFDPEGRCLWFAADPDGDLYRIDLSLGGAGGTPPELVLSATNQPSLSGVTRLLLSRHETLGRVMIGSPEDTADPSMSADVVLLIDSDNDALFDDVQVVPLGEHLDSRASATVLSDGTVTPSTGVPWSEPWLFGGGG